MRLSRLDVGPLLVIACGGLVGALATGVAVSRSLSVERPAPEPAGVVEPRAAEKPVPEQPEAPGREELSETPTFTPWSVRPEILNRTEVVAAMQREYPPLLRDAGIGGAVQVFFFIDEEGHVVNRQIARSSGHRALDDAALRVAEVYRFSPALNRDWMVPVWVSFGVTFQVR